MIDNNVNNNNNLAHSVECSLILYVIMFACTNASAATTTVSLIN
jgi:membrane protein involved in colicin uptake